MKTKNVLITLSVVAVIAVIVYLIVRSLKKSATDLIHNTEDAVANTSLGDLIGLRTNAAQTAFGKLIKMNFLKHTWITRANLKYNAAPYQIRDYLTTQQATDYARELKKSKAIVSTDFFNDNSKALAVIMSLKNWVQAAQVADAYYNIGNNKDLNRGLAWMSNEALIEAADYLSDLPTGVYLNGVELKKEQITV